MLCWNWTFILIEKYEKACLDEIAKCDRKKQKPANSLQDNKTLIDRIIFLNWQKKYHHILPVSQNWKLSKFWSFVQT